MKTGNILSVAIVCVAFILLPFTGTAQNYQCLQPGVKHYFTNSNGYLRGIRIDSVKTYTDSTVFYPFHTPRGRFYMHTGLVDSTEGSWLGKKVVALTDGTFLFDNMWNDTVIIKTQAHTGDTWNLYDDTTKRYYQAEILAEDTMTILGVLDSVKNILITAHEPSGIITADPADSFRIVLSKNNGFVQAIDLYTFPYHAPDSVYNRYEVDYFLDQVIGRDVAPSQSNSLFNLIPFTWPTRTQLFNWNIGDVYQIKNCISAYDPNCPYPMSFSFDSVTGKTVYPDSVQYTTTGWVANQKSGFKYILDVYYPYARTITNNSFTVVNTPMFDTSVFPEENNQHLIFGYFPQDNSYCITGEEYTTAPSAMLGNGRIINFFESSGPYYSYKNDINLTYYNYYSMGGTYPEEVDSKKLTYYTHNGITCGTYVGPETLGVDEIPGTPQTFSLSPNPASETITITSSGKINELTITNLLGQAMYTGSKPSSKIQIDISSFPAGIYIARLNGTEVRKFVKQ